MRWFFSAIMGIAAIFISFQVTQAQDALWKVEFYTNPFLAGQPAATTTVESVNYDWSTGAPFTGFQTDDFSIRFTRNVSFAESGLYRFTVNADDHFELGIDQKVVLSTIEEGAPGDPKSVDVNLTAGVHTIQLSYQEFIGFAFIFFDWKKVGESTTVNPGTGGEVATVNVATLNVRDQPGITGNILTKISRGQSFPVVARNENGSWIQINVNGQTGWVSAPLVRVSGNAPQPNVTQTPSAPNAPRTLVNLNFRTGPDTEFESLEVIPRGSVIELMGRNADSSWLRINFNGRSGWVIARFVRWEGGNFNNLPVAQ